MGTLDRAQGMSVDVGVRYTRKRNSYAVPTLERLFIGVPRCLMGTSFAYIPVLHRNRSCSAGLGVNGSFIRMRRKIPPFRAGLQLDHEGPPCSENGLHTISSTEDLDFPDTIIPGCE